MATGSPVEPHGCFNNNAMTLGSPNGDVPVPLNVKACTILGNSLAAT